MKSRLLAAVTVAMVVVVVLSGCGAGAPDEGAGASVERLRSEPTADSSSTMRATTATNSTSSTAMIVSSATSSTQTSSSTTSASDSTSSTAPSSTAVPATSVSSTDGEPAPTTPTAPTTAAAEPSSTAAPEPVSASDRGLGTQTWAPFATFEDVTLVQPSIRVEHIGFHESNHDGARQLVPVASVLSMGELPSRQRDTGSHTAADVVVEPGTEIRAPVTGTVIRAGGYILYCEHNDDFVVIEPDSHPGWEVKVLHISGVQVAPGDRVEAGVTVLAPAATPLPFDSQVDDYTAEPSWPHVHIELVDPSIPDRPSPGGGC